MAHARRHANAALVAVLALGALTAVTALVAQAGPSEWWRASSTIPITARTYHAVGASDTAVVAVGGEGAASLSSPALTTTAYTYGSVVQASLGVSTTGGAITYAADRAATATAQSVVDTSTQGYTLIGFGGLGAGGAPTNTLARFSYATRAWSTLQTFGGTAPSARSLAAAVYLPLCYDPANLATDYGCFVVTGGVDATGTRLTDGGVLFLDGLKTGGRPYWQAPPGLLANGPSARHSATIVAGLDGATAYAFGGDTVNGVSNSLHVLSPWGFTPPQATEMDNVALGRLVNVSSSDPLVGGNPQRATDGNTAGIMNPAPTIADVNNPIYNLCTSTPTTQGAGAVTGTTNPWLRVDLGAPNAGFDGVQFFTRTDCGTTGLTLVGVIDCYMRASGFAIAYGNDGTSWDAAGNFNPNTNGYACYDIPDTPHGGKAFVHCPGAVGRYVWLYLPGTNRVLSVCELQVLRAHNWVWRTLSAGSPTLINAAVGKKAFMTSELSRNGVAFEARLAVDGQASYGLASGTCAHTDSTGGTTTQRLVVDLGDAYDVSTVEVFPLTIDGDSVMDGQTAAQRNNGWQVSIGYSSVDGALNTQCVTPQSMLPATGANAPGSVVLPCPATGRFLVISRTAGANGIPAGGNNGVGLCEVRVWAAPLTAAPAPRAGAAAATYGGQIVLFGGYDGAGYRLNDIRFFDLSSNKWRPAIPPLAQPPAGRAYAGLVAMAPYTAPGGFPAPSGAVVVVGGSGATDALADIWELDFPQCPAFDMFGVNTGQTFVLAGNTVWQYVCQAGFVDANALTTRGTLVCGPDGVWVGVTPPCRGAPPAAVTSVTAVGLPARSPDNGAMSVSWASSPTAQYYDVIAAASGFTYIGFDQPAAPLPAPQFGPYGAYFVDPTAVAYVAGGTPVGANPYYFERGWLTLTAAAGSFCLGTTNRCPRVVQPLNRNIPPSLNGNLSAFLSSVAFESRVGLPQDSPYLYYEVGLGLYSEGKVVGGVAGAFEFVTTLYRAQQANGATLTAACAYQPHAANWATDQNCIVVSTTAIGSDPKVDLKIERSRGTNGAWEGFFRVSPSRDWITFGRRFTATQAIGGVLVDRNLSAAVFVMQEESFFVPNLANERVDGDIDYLKVGDAECSRLGQHRRVTAPATSVEIEGLIPAAAVGVEFTVAACTTSAGCSVPTRSTSYFPPAYVRAPTSPAPPNTTNGGLVLVSRGKTATQYNTFNGQVASRAVDGNYDQTNPATCSSTLGVFDNTGLIPEWQLDLGSPVNVAQFVIYNRADFNPQWLSTLEVYVGLSPNWSEMLRCDPLLVPGANAAVAPYIISFPCAKTGRYVAIRTGSFDSRIQLCEVEVWAYNTCPDARSINTIIDPLAIGGPNVCDSTATVGATCTQSCASGTIPVAGTPTITCMGGSWSAQPLLCAPACASTAFAAPANTLNMRTTLLQEDFSANQSTVIMKRWAPLDTAQMWGTAWSTADSKLQAMGAPASCGQDLTLVSSITAIGVHTAPFLLNASVATPDAAGLVFRASTMALDNSYRFLIDVAAGEARMEVVRGQVTTILQETFMTMTPWVWYALQVYYDGTGFALSVNNVQVMYVVDTALASGYAGVWAATRAEFDDFWYLADATTCAGVTAGQSCVMECAPGYTQIGNLRLACVDTSVPPSVLSSAAWNTSIGSCVLPAPYIANTSISIAESCLTLPVALQAPCAKRGSNAGLPLASGGVAVLDAQLVYTIVSGNTATVNGVPYASVFAIEACSGQLVVNQPAALIAAANPVFNLVIQVAYAGTTLATVSSATANVIITVFPVPQPPVLPVLQTLSLPENSLPGTVVGSPNATGSLAGTTWTLVSDNGAGGRFVMSPSGVISVAPTNKLPLNFEDATAKVFNLVVSVALTAVPTAFTTGTVAIALTDVNDPARYVGTVTLTVSELAVAGTSILPSLVPAEFVDEDRNPAFIGTISLTLQTPAAGLTLCNLTTATLPTFDGTSSTAAGNQLFTLPVASSTLLVVAPALPRTGATFVYNNSVARARYDVCFSFTDSQFVGQTFYASVPIISLANTAATPVVSRVVIMPVGASAAGATLNPAGGDAVYFVFASPPSPPSTAPIANYSNCGTGNATSRPVGCTSYSPPCTWGTNLTLPNVTAGTTVMRCTAVAGVGSNHVWSLWWGTGVAVVGTVPLVTSYTAPVVINYTMTGGAMLTAGGTTVVFSGRNLMGVTAVYMGTSNAAGAYQFSCTPLAPIAGQNLNTTLRCAAGVGAGAGLPYVLVAGTTIALSGSVAAPFNFISYQPPQITGVSVSATFAEPAPANASVLSIRTLPTAGGTTFYVRGTNFGPVADLLGVAIPFTMTYGRPTAREYTATCVHSAVTPHTALTCVTAPGAGGAIGGIGLPATMIVAGQSQVTPTNGSLAPVPPLGLAYVPPVITSISGEGQSGGPTAGGAVLTIFATGTGPVGAAAPPSVSFGPAGNLRFATTSCTVIVPDVAPTMGQIRCITPPGTGAGLVTQLVVAGQASAIFSAVPISYAAPVVTSFALLPTGDVNSLSTDGGNTVLINGANFGPADGIAPLAVTYVTTVALRSGAGAPNTTGAAAGGGTTTLRLVATGCSVLVAHSTIRCTTQAGAGAGLRWTVSVDGVTSTTPTTSYAAPVVSTLSAVDLLTGAPVDLGVPLDPNRAYIFTINGSAFGTNSFPLRVGSGGPNGTFSTVPVDLVSAVTYGPTGTEYTPNWTHVDSRTIRATVGPASGVNSYFRVTVAGQSTTAVTPAFSFAAPVITAIAPAWGPCVLTNGQYYGVTLTVRNVPALDKSATLVVQIGSGSTWATVTPSAPMNAADLAAWPSNGLGDGSIDIAFGLPRAWAGQNIGVKLVALSLAGGAIATSNVVGFSYNTPSIASVYTGTAVFSGPCPWPADPNGRWACDGSKGPIYTLELHGTDFGENPLAMAFADPATRYLDVAPATPTAPASGPSATPGPNATSATPTPAPVVVWAPATTWSAGGGAGSAGDTATVMFWSNTVIRAYTTVPVGLTRVRLTNMDRNGVPASATSNAAAYEQTTLNVTVVGNTTDVPTTGGTAAAPLALTVIGLTAGVDTLTVTVGDAPCAFVAAPGGAYLVTFTYSPTGTYYCVLPPGAGRAVPIIVTRVTAGLGATGTVIAGNVAYSRPALTSVDAWQPVLGDWQVNTVLPPGSLQPTVRVPTNGSVIRVRGANLGASPQLLIFALGGTAVLLNNATATPCAGTAGTHTCYTFPVPPGQGSGFTYGPRGWALDVNVGGQTSAVLGFAYNSPVVTSVTATSAATGAPVSVPPLGVTPSGDAVIITLTGRDFGVPTVLANGAVESGASVTVSFFRALDGPSTAFTCNNPTRSPDGSTITCTLPPGTGAGLTVRVSALESQWYGDSTPGFSYDAPTVTAAYALVRAVSLPPHSTPANLSTWSLGCPTPQFSVLAPAAVPASALAGWLLADGSSPMAASWCNVVGGNVDNVTGAVARLSGTTVGAIPDATGALQQTLYIVVVGSNFGPASLYNPRVHCARLAWAALGNSAASAACDGAEGFLGEGEIASASVLRWDNNIVAFAAPAGTGAKFVELNVRGGSLYRTSPPVGGVAAPVPFSFLAPVITSITVSTASGTLSAAGGTIMTVTGYNFGPVPYAGAAMIGGGATVPLTLAPTLPTASLRIEFAAPSGAALGTPGAGPQCQTSALTVDGMPTPFGLVPYATCAAGVLTTSQTSITLTAPYGVGAGRNVTVAIVDGITLLPSVGGVAQPPVVIRSNSVPVSFAVPVLSSPATADAVLVDGGAHPASVTMSGYHLGDARLSTDAWWAPSDRSVDMTVGGVVCTPVTRTSMAPGTGLGAIAYGTAACVTDPWRTPAGLQPVTITVAGQRGTADPALGSNVSTVVIGCRTGFFARAGEVCVPCPTQGATCPGYLIGNMSFAARFSYPVVSPGWYNFNGTAASACPPSTRYNSSLVGAPIAEVRDVCLAPCVPAEACLADNVCAPGYTSVAPNFRCGTCAPSYYKSGGACVQCPSGAVGILIGYLVLVLLVAAAAYLTQRAALHVCVASIGIDFFQVVAIFGATKVEWPETLKSLLHVLSAFNANVEIVAPECYLPNVSFVSKFEGILLLPIALAGALALVHGALLFHKVVIMRRGGNAPVSRHAPVLIACMLVVMYFIYLYEANTLLAVFDCAPTFPADGGNQYYLAAVPGEVCGDTGGVWGKIIAPSIVGLIVYTAGYPLAVLALLVRNRELVMEDQLLRAKGVGNDRLTNPHAYEFRKRYSTLYASFRPDVFYWVGIILARKLLVVLVPVLFDHSASFQMAAVLLVLMVAYGLHVRNAPYMSPANAEAVLRAHAESSFTSAVHARIRASIAGIESRGRKKTRHNLLDAAGRVDRNAVISVLTSWLFDPNTVEAALLFAAAIVALMGIMFESEALTSGYYGGARAAVSDVALVVIIGSILYWAIVLLVECVTLYSDRSREAALAKRRRTSKASPKSPSAGAASPRPSSSVFNAALGITDSTAARRAEGAANTGQLDVALNPLFLNSGAPAAGAAASTSALDAVRSFKSASPPLDMWRVIASNYEDLHVQAAAMAAELAAAKIALEKVQGGEAAPASNRAGRASARMTFDPQAASSGGDADSGARSARMLASYSSTRGAALRS